MDGPLFIVRRKHCNMYLTSYPNSYIASTTTHRADAIVLSPCDLKYIRGRLGGLNLKHYWVLIPVRS